MPERLYAASSILRKHNSRVTCEPVTVHFGPSEYDGSNVSEREVYSGRHPMSKRT